MAKIFIDNNEIEIIPGDTIIKAAARAGIEIPHFCYHPELQYAGSCRMCLVEVEKSPKLLTACSTMATDGMIVRTKTERVKKAREAVLEFLLINHPLDCPICDKAGECPLQNNYYKYSGKDSRYKENKWQKSKKVDLGPTIVHDQERCILCTRCVRFMDAVAKSPQLVVAKRGHKNILTTYPGQPLDNPYSLNTVDLCPVGALTSKDFRFKCRTWFLKSSKSLCAFCATGCNTIVQHKDNYIHRILPDKNDSINGSFMCDYGRLYRKFLHAESRIYSPALIQNGRFHEEQYQKAIDAAASKINGAVKKDGAASIGVIISPYLSIEEAYVAARWLSDSIVTPNIAVVNYENGFNDFKYSDNYLVSEDKSPNKAGVGEILKSFKKSAITVEQLAKTAASGRLKCFVFIGPAIGLNEIFKIYEADFKKCESKIAISTHNENFAAIADILIPFRMWLETSGHYVNKKGISQSYRPAVAFKNNEIKENIEILCDLASKTGAKIHFTSAAAVFEQINSRLGLYKPLKAGVIA